MRRPSSTNSISLSKPTSSTAWHWSEYMWCDSDHMLVRWWRWYWRCGMKNEGDVKRFRINDLSDANSGTVCSFMSIGTAMCLYNKTEGPTMCWEQDRKQVHISKSGYSMGPGTRTTLIMTVTSCVWCKPTFSMSLRLYTRQNTWTQSVTWHVWHSKNGCGHGCI